MSGRKLKYHAIIKWGKLLSNVRFSEMFEIYFMSHIHKCRESGMMLLVMTTNIGTMSPITYLRFSSI